MGNSNQNLYSRGSAGSGAKVDGKKSGFAQDPGPFEAIVVGHAEGSRMGQLLVQIPDWSGLVTAADGVGKDSNQIPVSYASPFYGTTFGTDSQQNPDSAQTSGQSYGMWMVPPDIGNKVLVIFTPQGKGYWIGCVYDSPSHHMVPGIGRNVGGKAKTTAPDEISTYLTSDTVAPVVEYNTKQSTSYTNDGLENTPRFAHDFQTLALVSQGLDKDPIRGAISSSSLRESPSNVYGISTPGPKSTKTDQIAGQKQVVFARKGGHQFVMDDGDADGNDQLIRLRTSGGHQILMNDTENIVYIANKTGNQWFEFSADGSINVYGAAGINMRSQGPMNYHSDAAIIMNAPVIELNSSGSATSPIGSVSISSSGGVNIQAMTTFAAKSVGTASISAIGMTSITSGAKLSMSAVGWLSINSDVKTSISGGIVNIDGGMLMLNCAKPSLALPPIPPLPKNPKAHPDALFTGTSWQKGGKTVKSECSVVPGHEPWDRPQKK